YWDQLQSKKHYIELQKENIENKKSLVEMGKIAYEAQKISLFEYLAYQNSYMDSLITLADAKLEYVTIQSMLEETLGIMLGEQE
ncbi:TolC family protein, partial [uncultured Helicobacter sp.]